MTKDERTIAIRAQAEREVQDEEDRAAIDKLKIHIRAKRERSIWRKLFPYKLVRI